MPAAPGLTPSRRSSPRGGRSHARCAGSDAALPHRSRQIACWLRRDLRRDRPQCRGRRLADGCTGTAPAEHIDRDRAAGCGLDCAAVGPVVYGEITTAPPRLARVLPGSGLPERPGARLFGRFAPPVRHMIRPPRPAPRGARSGLPVRPARRPAPPVRRAASWRSIAADESCRLRRWGRGRLRCWTSATASANGSAQAAFRRASLRSVEPEEARSRTLSLPVIWAPRSSSISP